MKTEPVIRMETESDRGEAERLTRDAFWNVYRPGCTEHYVLHVLRRSSGFVPELDLVMELDGRLVGHIIYMRSHISDCDGREIPVMTFGPLSISPEYQHIGLGSLLLRESMARARALGAGALCIEGNPKFYGRAGFSAACEHGISCDGAEPSPYFLLAELESGYLDGVSGVYHTPRAYFVDEDEAARFDSRFPPREKLRLPGQLF